MFKRKKYIRLILIIYPVLIIMFILNVEKWKFDFGGSYYVGKGKVEIEYKLGSHVTGKLNEAVMKWDAVRLNQSSSGSNDWYLDFNELPIKLDHEPLLSTTMYITIKLDEPPKSGAFNSAFWSGPKAYIEIWSPRRSAEEPDAKRLLKFRLKHVQLTFDEVELRLSGKFIGKFTLEEKEIVINGKLDLLLQDAPPLLPVVN